MTELSTSNTIIQPIADSSKRELVPSASPTSLSRIVLEESIDPPNEILFDIHDNMDLFKRSLEGSNTQGRDDLGAYIDQKSYYTAITEDRSETVSSSSYRPLPTSSSLEQPRESDTSFEDIEDIDLDDYCDFPINKVRLPAMEIVIRNIGIAQERKRRALLEKSLMVKPDTNEHRSESSQDINFNMETPIDVNLYSSSLTNPQIIKDVPVNQLTSREQEQAGNYPN